MGTGFESLGLPDPIIRTLTALGYSEPTPIQSEAIPPLLAGRDLLGQAATGTGKTAAFALPALARIEGESVPNSPAALILVPTRELAVQVQKATQEYARGSGASVLAVFGGQPIGRQIGPLKRGVDIVVATPGRALDHIRRNSLRTDRLQILVLDEADEMLDMGFAEEIEAILEGTPESRQTMLFSATMPPRIESIARRHMTNPVRIEIERDAVEAGESPRIRQVAHLVARNHKPAALGRVLDMERPESAIVFCRTRHEVDQLTETLGNRGFRADALHGGMTQEQRDRAMGRLRSGSTELLVATDVAARGLDVDHLTHVFNYGLPTAAEQYVHRIGRVGRAGRTGTAITLAEPREKRHIKSIQRLTNLPVSVEDLPTVAALRKKRLAQTKTALIEVLGDPEADTEKKAAARASELAPFRAVVDSLSSAFEPAEIAAAALKMAHEASGQPIDEREIPGVETRKNGPRSNGKPGGKQGFKPGGKPGFKSGGKPGRTSKKGGPSGDHTRLFFSVGRSASVAPRDLVGAIANEGGLSGNQIGAIEIKENFSLVDVPAGAADSVIKSMRSSRIKGRKATIRRERF
ncbi:MAG: DEAD/DEAH box helicase [Actinomycetota bacterium]|nr:DEAD/DEAH box helicase [Actinomycetota bacterium]